VSRRSYHGFDRVKCCINETFTEKETCLDDGSCIGGAICLCLSIFLQFVGGILLIIVARREKKTVKLKNEVKNALNNSSPRENNVPTTTQQTNVNEKRTKKERKIRKTEHLNTAVLVITFTVTVVNICILALEFD
jgi:hypothetical protein